MGARGRGSRRLGAHVRRGPLPHCRQLVWVRNGAHKRRSCSQKHCGFLSWVTHPVGRQRPRGRNAPATPLLSGVGEAGPLPQSSLQMTEAWRNLHSIRRPPARAAGSPVRRAFAHRHREAINVCVASRRVPGCSVMQDVCLAGRGVTQRCVEPHPGIPRSQFTLPHKI